MPMLVRMFRRVVLALAVCTPAAGFAQDAPGCKDHPALTRLPNYRISRCPVSDFDSHAFLVGKGKEVKVEGRVTEIMYNLNEGAVEPSRLQIHRNYENAITRIGGQVAGKDDDGNLYLKLAKDGKELWVHVSAYIGSQFMVHIVEKGAMKQDVEANAAALAGAIKSTGKIAVYGITFDTGKTDIKPESTPTLEEISKLLKEQPSLKLFVVGHTDNVAAFDLNMRLSQGRAEAVVKALTGKYGIAAARLKAQGVGPLAPVAANDDEAGRAKNRRVELVKQ